MPVLRHIYDSVTGSYHNVEVSQEVYDCYQRSAWNIHYNDRQFYAHEIQFSSLLGGSDEYSFPICELLKATHAHERFPLAEPTPPPEKISVRERLRTAVQEVHRQASGHGHDRGGEAR